MLHIKQFTFNAFEENTYVVSDESKSCIIIDTGCYTKVECDTLQQYVESEKLTVEKLVNTHCHIDHVLGNAFAKELFKVPLLVPRGETEVLRAVPAYAQPWGFAAYQHAAPDDYMENSGALLFGETTLEILFVPGHSPGHLAFYHKESKQCINGDVLFNGSIGRSDLPGGDHQTLLKSISEVMFDLPEDTVVYCGHGPSTSIGHEKATNPFF